MKRFFPALKRKIMKVYTALGAAFLTSVFGTVNAFAAGFNTAALKTGIQTGLIAVMGIIGGGLAVFGVIELVGAQGEQDPNAKSKAIRQVAAGLGIILVSAILIPVFISAITF
jgi:uncharacterized membrane-anchored protein